MRPRLRQPSSPYRLRRPRARGSHAAVQEIPAAGAPQPGTPAYLQQAYDLSYLSQTGGTGTTIAVVNAFHDPNAESDLAVYRAEFGLSPCSTGNGCFSEYDQNGGTNYPTKVDPGWELETSLDLDAVSALCPNCHIALIEANSDQVTDLGAAQMTAGQLPGVSVISDSWDVPLTGFTAARNFATSADYSFPGVTTVAASGDSGYPGSQTNNFPAALPKVTAAGGTTLVPASTSGVQSVREFNESAWSGAGSGCNKTLSKPIWQTDTGCTGRSYTDISADGDPNTGMQVYDSGSGASGWGVVGGTSEAAPLIAAYYALLGPTAQGPAWAYANASLLNDPSTGSNGTCDPSIVYICNAGPGYDGPTGAGSISGAVTTGAPGITGPGTTGSYTQSVTADTAHLQGAVYPNGADTTYWWEYGPITSTSYPEQTLPSDVGSGSAPLPVTGSFTDLQPATSYHYRLVAQNSFGTEYGYDYTLTTAPSSTTSPTQTTTSPQSPPPTTTTTPGSEATGSGGSGGSAGTGTTATSAPALSNVRVAAAATNATVSATVSGRGAATTYMLQYGTTQALGRSVSGSLAASSASTANVSLALRNLSPGKIYYFRVVAGNAAGTTASAPVRFKTSPVTITHVKRTSNKLQVVLSCHGSATCRVRLQVRSGARVLLAGQGTIRANRSGTITLGLSRSFHTLATHGKTSKLYVLSTWNGSTASVSATV